MKIQCNVCESAEAKVLCCADEAALCWSCDHKVHSANKLVGKHQRIPLSTSSSQMPKCDICQENVGYFFCLEDRALLCRKCDVAIHTSNSLVSGHQRFLLTGVKVGLEVTETDPPPSSRNIPSHSHSSERIAKSEAPSQPIKSNNAVSSTTVHYNRNLPVQTRVSEDVSASRLLPYAGGSATGSSSQWQMDDLFELGDGNQIFNFMDNDLSKPDSGKLGESDCSRSPILRPADGELEGDEFMGQVADTYWTVPEIASPPTASGLHWSKNSQNLSDFAAFVPDISCSPLSYRHSHSDITKRRRRF